MLLYHGAMDARFERLCHRISRSLAEITSAHHPSDVKLFQHWRGLVHLCVPLLSESHHDDSASFVRSIMWGGYLLPPATSTLWKNMDHAYADVFYAIREMMGLVAVAAAAAAAAGRSPEAAAAGAEQEQLQLAEHLAAIDKRLSILHARWLRQAQHRRCCWGGGNDDAPAAEEETRAGLDIVRHRIPFV